MSSRKLNTMILAWVLSVFISASSATAQSDVPNSKDHPMFSRMPGYYISDYREEEFAAYDFADENGDDVTVEGQFTEIVYTLPDNAPRAAKLKVLRNFSNAITKIGGKFYEYAGNSVYMNVLKDGQEVWARVYASEDDYTLTIVQKGEVKQEITADWMLEELNYSGHVALYINFETGKAVIKPESATVVDQIAAMMKDNAELRIKVEGHTDNVGSDQENLELSDDRAKAVIQAIVARGIDAARLQAVGLGETKPIADNNTEDGRAKNRRVELVKI